MGYETIVRGIVTLVDNHHDCPTVQAELLADEVIDGIEHVQPYGMHFHPPVEAECIVAAVGDDRANCVAFGLNADGERPQDATQPGEGGLYYKGTYKVFIDANGVVHLGAKEGEDFVALAQKVDNAFQSLITAFNAHTHNDSTSNPTDVPLTQMTPPASVRSSNTKAT